MHASQDLVTRLLNIAPADAGVQDTVFRLTPRDTAWHPDQDAPITGPATLQYIRDHDGIVMVLITKDA